ncbi:MAG: 4Fe-4S dicluster domain-containing protein [Firmicutes bacterium]|nr:4Fe-4S dicluster domain-containing protein [Bacillota bacterium]
MARSLTIPNPLVLLPKKDLSRLVQHLMQRYTVVGPVAKGGEHAFSAITDPAQLTLDYVSSLLPPKKVLHQPFEVLFSFHQEQGVLEEREPARGQVLFGVHPCDVHAIEILDKAYGHEYPDPYYVNRRQNTLIVAANCTKVGDNCFCQSMGTGPDLQKGYDLLLTDLGSQILVEIGSPAGEDLLQQVPLQPAPRVMLVEKEKRLDEARRKFKKRLNTSGLKELLEDNFRHPIWDELRQDCLACGSCTMVCPTCFCYNVVDKLDLNLKSGQRQREWDSCMLLEYAQVAMGHNFRKDRDARIKQRIYHKLAYYEPQFGTLGCVGCGRCIGTCVKHIDITDIMARLGGE